MASGAASGFWIGANASAFGGPTGPSGLFTLEGAGVAVAGAPFEEAAAVAFASPGNAGGAPLAGWTAPSVAPELGTISTPRPVPALEGAEEPAGSTGVTAAGAAASAAALASGAASASGAPGRGADSGLMAAVYASREFLTMVGASVAFASSSGGSPADAAGTVST